MGSRLELHEVLLGLGTTNVYFQPPASKTIKYPAIVYHKSGIDSTFASNKPYTQVKKYSIVVIVKDPDSVIPDKVAQLPLCKSGSPFTKDNLYHDVFTLYY